MLIKYEIKKPSHAYVIIGDEKNQNEFINAFAGGLQIKPVDIYTLDSQDKIKIQEIRVLQHQISLKPHSSKFKLAIIKNAEKLTLEASNAMLKTLEEPPKNSILVLLSKNEENFLPTVLSRVRKIKLASQISLKLSEEKQIMFKNLQKSSLKDKFSLADKLAKEELEEDFLEQWLIYLRAELLGTKKTAKLIKLIQKSQKMLKKNINTRLMLENILLEIE